MFLPFMKLGTLALRTLSKPIASRLKQQSAVHPRFRDFIVNVAQRHIYGHSTDVEIRPLNEEKAVQAAGDLIGELFVFSVAGALVILEVQRSSRSEAKKEELRSHELQGLRKMEEEIAKELELVKQRVSEIEKNSKGWNLLEILHLKEFHSQQPTSSLPAVVPS